MSDFYEYLLIFVFPALILIVANCISYFSAGYLLECKMDFDKYIIKHPLNFALLVPSTFAAILSAICCFVSYVGLIIEIFLTDYPVVWLFMKIFAILFSIVLVIIIVKYIKLIITALPKFDFSPPGFCVLFVLCDILLFILNSIYILRCI